jgi:hypothetical protein
MTCIGDSNLPGGNYYALRRDLLRLMPDVEATALDRQMRTYSDEQ